MTSSSAPQQSVEYGADEISALVLDPGYSVTRAGFAGEDHPKSVLSTYYGVSEQDGKVRHVFDDNAIHNPFANLDIRNPMADDSTVDDWDIAPKLWEYSITSRLTVPPRRSIRSGGLDDSNGDKNGDTDVVMEDIEAKEKPLTESPLLVAEPGWNPAKNREKTIEIAMEDWGVPAFYLGRDAVLSTFAAGKSSALIVDVGASTASVTPVHDGMILKKGIRKSDLAGIWVSDQIRLMLETGHPSTTLRPHYLVQSKERVDAGAPANFKERKFTTAPPASFHRFQEERVLTEFKESCVQIWTPQINSQQNLTQSADYIKSQGSDRPFEMPDGSNDVFGIERYKVVEGLFDPAAALIGGSVSAPKKEQCIPDMIRQSLAAVDVDVRPHLLNNVVVTGGTTMIQGFNDRLNYELLTLYPGGKVRVTAPGNVYERKFASWIGGSILASLGTFHQLWVSKKEYDEGGASIVERRCR